MTTATPKRPIMRYHGGKWKLAPWILEHFPRHRVYVEPFGGAASVLLRKERSYAEVYNDLDGEVVNLFRVARDRGEELKRAIYLTPFARDEFWFCYEPSEDPVEQARRTVGKSLMGFGSNVLAVTRGGFRSNSNKSGTTPAHDWANYPKAMELVIERLRGVIIENRDGREVMAAHDGEKTLHYVDPPYLHETRKTVEAHGQRGYAHELTNEEHRALLIFLRGLKGMVVLSGYRSDLYDECLSGWRKVERLAHADGAQPRVECLWVSPNVEIQTGMF